MTPGEPISVRYAAEYDLPAIVMLVEEKRRDLERFNPVFWKRLSMPG